MKIMIVDNEINRTRSIRSILANIGYKSGDVDSLDDPTAALAAMKKKRFDVVFICFDMPKDAGQDFLKEIRDTNRLKATPAVAYSSEVSHQGVLSAVQMGANAFLGHPCSVSDVEGVLSQATKGKR